MNDRELLEMAAKAAGINVDCWDEDPFDPAITRAAAEIGKAMP